MWLVRCWWEQFRQLWLPPGLRLTQSTAHHTYKRNLTFNLVSCMQKTRTTQPHTPTSLKHSRTYQARSEKIDLRMVLDQELTYICLAGGRRWRWKGARPSEVHAVMQDNAEPRMNLLQSSPFLLLICFSARRCDISSFAENGRQVRPASRSGMHASCCPSASEPKPGWLREGTEGLQERFVFFTLKLALLLLRHLTLAFANFLFSIITELSSDPTIRTHLAALYDTLLEQNLLRIVEPYSVVEIEYVAQQVGQGRQNVESKYVLLSLLTRACAHLNDIAQAFADDPW